MKKTYQGQENMKLFWRTQKITVKIKRGGQAVQKERIWQKKKKPTEVLGEERKRNNALILPQYEPHMVLIILQACADTSRNISGY